MTRPVTIRALRTEDRSEWAELWHDYLAFYEAEVSDAVYDSTFGRLIGVDPQDFSCLVAEQNGRLVGLTHYLFHRHAWTLENSCYLQDLYAHPETRGIGVGRALIEAVYAASDEQGNGSVYWLTQEFNHTARKLYDKIGKQTPFIRYQRA